jgi:lysozyme
MTPESRQKLRSLLVQHESYRQYPYCDITGHITIGIGRNLSDRGISQTEAFTLLDDDIIYFSGKLSQLLSYFNQLDDNTKIALLDMCFSLGVTGFLNFHRMHAAMEKDDRITASNEILNSKWANQVGQRALTISNIVKTREL